MTQGKVIVTALQTGSGATNEVERSTLFIGEGAENIDQIVAISAQSDFDTLISENESQLKTQLQSWLTNGDEAVTGWAIPINNSSNVLELIDNAMAQDISPEIIVITTPVTGVAEVQAYQTKAQEILNVYARRVRFLVAVPGCQADQSWSEHYDSIQPLVDDVLAPQVALVPLLFGDELGGVTGRLCKRSVTIADSPMRVLTGGLSLMPKPVDKNGTPLTNAVTGALDAIRFSCTQFYTDFAGVYFGSVNMLDAEGGDFQKIEAGRVVDKAARQVRIIGIFNVKNRQFNDSSTGIAYAKRVLLKPLRDMAKSITIGEDRFPGEIQEPTDESISIVFTSPTEVQVIMKIKPINSPSTIIIGIALDTE